MIPHDELIFMHKPERMRDEKAMDAMKLQKRGVMKSIWFSNGELERLSSEARPTLKEGS